MRFKKQIFEYMQKCKMEEKLMNIRREMGDNAQPFVRMNDEQFIRILNTFCALHSMYYKGRKEIPIIPTNADVMEAMLVMKADMQESQKWTNALYDGELHKSLMKPLKKNMACAEYFIQLALDNFFATNEDTTEKTELEQLS